MTATVIEKQHFLTPPPSLRPCPQLHLPVTTSSPPYDLEDALLRKDEESQRLFLQSTKKLWIEGRAQ